MIKKARDVVFSAGQKLYNPRHVRDKAPKLQRSWEDPYKIVKKVKRRGLLYSNVAKA